MRLHFMLLLCFGGTVSAATLHPIVTYATASDVAREPLANVAKTLFLQRWSKVMMSSATMDFLSREAVYRPERQQGDTPIDFSTDFDEAVQAFAGGPLPIGPRPIVRFEGLGAGFLLSGVSAFTVAAQPPD